MDGLTIVQVVAVPLRKHKRSATMFTPIWIESVGLATTSLKLPQAQCSTAPASQWVIRIPVLETAIFSEPHQETLRPITCHHRREGILSLVKLRPATVTTGPSQWTSSGAE